MMSTIRGCRLCGNKRLRSVIDFGHTPLANAYLSTEQLGQMEPTYPLTLVFCPRCSLVQIRETVSSETLFGDYLYFSSFSRTTLKHSQELARLLTKKYGLGRKSLVAEVASNDGYLLQYFAKVGIPVLGIEPAANIAAVARRRGIRTISEFFDERLARSLVKRGRRADVVIANNVIAHVPDINGFVKGMGRFIKKEGVVVVEIPYLMDVISRCEFDMVYHEHLCYYSAKALGELFRRNGLKVTRVEHLPIQGGSLRVYAERQEGAVSDGTLEEFLQKEREAGLYELGTYSEFAERVDKLRGSILRSVVRLKANGASIAAYGAAAKATTFLHHVGIGRNLLDFVVDRSTYKQGRFMPGNHIPIYPTSRLVEKMPDYTLILAWNFADEVLEQEHRYRRKGGKFIVPIPRVKVV